MDDATKLRLLDVASLVGFGIVALSLALPWERTQTCPPLRDCRPWETHLGWESVGPFVAVSMGVVLLGLFLRSGLAKRTIAYVVAIAIGVALLLQRVVDFAAFVEIHTLPGIGVAFAGTVIAGIASAWAATLVQDSSPIPLTAASTP